MSDLHDPELLPLWHAIRDRLVIDGDLTTIRRVSVQLSTAGLARINGWLARAPHQRRTRLTASNGVVKVPIDRLLEALGPTVDLAGILRDTVGMPEVLQPHRRLAALKTNFWSYAAQVLPQAPQLIQHLRAGGLSDSSTEERRRLIDALARAHQLVPLQRPVPLPRLSLYCSGDPHYFDLNPPGRGNKLVMLVAEIMGEPAVAVPNERFALLARAGIHPDRLSSTVLTLNLDATGDGPIDDAIRAATATGRPLHISLYDLTSHRPRFSPAVPVTVVENPSVIEEALLRRHRQPLACTSGALSAVDHEFLRQLVDHHVTIRYSGDWDPAGRLIANVLRTQFGAQIITPPGIDSTTALSHLVVFQESSTVLDLLLGPDPSDPLTAADPAEAHLPGGPAGTNPEGLAQFTRTHPPRVE